MNRYVAILCLLVVTAACDEDQRLADQPVPDDPPVVEQEDEGHDPPTCVALDFDEELAKVLPAGTCDQPGVPVRWDTENKSPRVTLSDDQLTASVPGRSFQDGVRATVGARSGRYYWEVELSSLTNDFPNGDVGVSSGPRYPPTLCRYDSLGYVLCDGFALADAFANGDVIGVALDLDNDRIHFSRNGVWAANDHTFTRDENRTVYPSITVSSGGIFTGNFAGPFAHPAPSGYGVLGSVGDCPSSLTDSTGFHDCSTSYGMTRAPLPGTQLRVVSLYESSQEGLADVYVEETAPTVLVLVSHDPTQWTVHRTSDADVRAVIALGVAEQTVVLADGCDVPVHTEEDFGCGYSLPYTGGYWGSCNTDETLDAIEARFGQVRQFDGCYRASSATLR